MSDATEQVLARAYELIEEDRLSEAEAILKPVLETDAENADAWWLYAHAVSDPETARMALNQVLRLDSNYEGAGALLDRLGEAYPAPAARETISIVPPPTLPSLPDDEDIESPDFLEEVEEGERVSRGFGDEPVFGDIDDSGEEERVTAATGGRNILPVILLLLLILSVIALIVVINPFGGAPATATPTLEVAAFASPADVATSIPVSSPEPAEATAEAMAFQIEVIVDRLAADYELPAESAETSVTSLGSTLLVSVCSRSGQELRDTLGGAMITVAQASTVIETGVDAIGVRLLDCEDNNRILRVIAVTVDDASAFVSGSLAEDDFQARWVAAA
jgi:hypothetical protein